jgi:RNA polymerase sigma factor (sigma-70 family)
LFKGEKMDVKHTPETKRKAVYEDLRPLLFSIAYRMVGSASEAEDIVQEAFLRFHRESSEGTKIESPKAWLSTVTTRLAINHVQSARVRRESYVGTWLPEPLLTDTESEGPRHADTADSLSMAFLVLLESLGPIERAVFLLREVFNYGYDEIATIVGKSEDNCRQIAVRARRQVEAKKPRFEASRKKCEELSRRFFDAVVAGDTEGLIGLYWPRMSSPTATAAARLPRSPARSMDGRRSRVSYSEPSVWKWPACTPSKSTGSRERCSLIPRAGSWWSCPSTSPTASCRRCGQSATPTSCIISIRTSVLFDRPRVTPRQERRSRGSSHWT